MTQNTALADARPVGWGDALSDFVRSLHRCQELGEARLAIVTVPTSNVDPWAFMTDARQPQVVWSNSRDGSALVGFGVATDVSVMGQEPGCGRMPNMDALSEEKVLRNDDTRDQVPLTFWGMRFAGDTSTDTAWSDWSPIRVFVPQLTVYRRVSEQVTFARLALWLTPETRVSDIEAELDASFSVLEGTGQDSLTTTHSPSIHAHQETEEEWNQRIARAVETINEGELLKVVAARCETITPPADCEFSVRGTLEQLRENHPKCTVFAVRGENGSTFLGATPETLLRVRGGEVHTHALAGTVGRSESPEEDQRLGLQLLASQKEQQEQLHVVRAVREALVDCVDELEFPSTPRLLRLRRVQHLVTDFQGKIKPGVKPTDLLFRLHPTPAVAGTPQQSAQAWIMEHEKMDRGWYAAPIGWAALNGDCAFRVALRCGLLTPHAMVAYAGAGIVAGSRPELEWAETSLKLETMKRAVVTSKRKAP